ncbi:hypothetical protein BH18ACT15_BH18ACT15_06990 [soil metagenome]
MQRGVRRTRLLATVYARDFATSSIAAAGIAVPEGGENGIEAAVQSRVMVSDSM